MAGTSSKHLNDAVLGHRKGLPTDIAAAALFFLTMGMNIAFASLSSCRTLYIRAK
jgi:hypothetical protein